MAEQKSREGRKKRSESKSDIDPTAQAAEAAIASPDNPEAWDRLEDLAASMQRPDDVAAAYRQVLAAEISRSLATQVGQRAMRFFDEWFGDDPQQLVGVLDRVLAIDPGAEWAFKRLTVVLTVAGRWDDLLSAYDRSLAATQDRERRVELLDEAAQAAKEFAGSPERAIKYLQQLHQIRPTDTQLSSQLERLLERQERWADLIDMWKERLGRMSREEVNRTRERIAEVYLDRLGDPQRALTEIESLLATGADDAASVKMLERILNMESAAQDVRRGALDLLRSRYDAAGRGTDVVRSVGTALGFVNKDERTALLREAGRRLAESGDHAQALQHFAELLREDPEATDAEEQLRVLASKAGLHEQRASALAAAADAAATPARRTLLLVEAADARREHLNDVIGAIALYARVLQSREAPPRVAIEVARRLEDLLARADRSEERLEVLESLAAMETDASERRRVLGLAARLAEDLGKVDRALASWKRRLDTDAGDLEALDATIELLERESRWEDLIGALRQRIGAAVSPLQKRADLARIAKIHAEELEQRGRAIAVWGEVQQQFGDDQDTVDALDGLLAAEGRYIELSELLERVTTRDTQRLEEVIARLGDVQRAELAQPDRAAASYKRALAIDPAHEGARAGVLALLERPEGRADAVAALERAYGATDDWQGLLGILEHRLAVARDDEARAALLSSAAEAREKRGGDLAGALADLRRALPLSPESVAIERNLLRLAEQTGEVAVAVDAIREAAAVIERRRAQQPSAVLDDRLARLRWLEATLVDEKLGDADAALGAYRAVADLQPRHADALRRIAAIARRAPGQPLFDALIRIADVAEGDLDPLWDAADLALETLHDHALARQVLSRLLDSAARLWRRGEPARGQRSPEAAAGWALDNLVRLHGEAGDHAQAVALQLEGSRLPFDAGTSRTLRRKAAERAARQLGDRARAIDLLRAILDETPADADTIAELAQLYQASDRIGDLLSLRKHELGLTTSPERRVELRLEIARLVGVIEERGGRVEVLRANLDELPGHDASIDALVQVLESKRSHAELADILTNQAQKLEAVRDVQRSARLWARVANLATKQLSDADRAIAAHRRVVALHPTIESLDALARLHVERGEHAKAIEWLERLLAGSEGSERPGVALRLARSHIATGKSERAVAVLEKAFGEAPADAQIRDLLVDLYRQAEQWEPLARVLADSTAYIQDADTLLAYVREAATIFQRVGTPDRAIPVLERAIPLVPEDRSMRSMLAEGLRVAGRTDEAKAIYEQLLAEFGRRRNPERAEVHHQLAQVLRAQGDVEGALAQLDLASQMDLQNTAILRTLGEVARESGQIERAERSFRALLLIVRRQQPDAPDVRVGSSEVLFDLHQISAQRGQDDQARELLDSALDVAAQSTAEMQRFERTLLARGAHDLLLRALELRLARVSERPAQAEIHARMSDVLDKQLGRLDAALEARLRALDLSFESTALHESTRELARRAGAPQKYAAALGTIIDRLRRKEDGPLAASLLMRLGRVHEEDLGDPNAAREAYRRADAAAEGQVDAQIALARIAGQLGDSDEEMRLLGRIAEAPAESVAAESRAEALYRLAELELAQPDLSGRGVATLQRAADLSPDTPRAGAILARAAAGPGGRRLEVISLYEQTARTLGDRAMLLDAVVRRVGFDDVTVGMLREAVELASEQGDAATAERLLERAVGIAQNGPDGIRGAAWALPKLAAARQAAGDATGALRWMEQAVQAADEGDRRALQLQLAATAAAPEGGDLEIAARTYEHLLEPDPTAREVWEPLLGVYHRLKDRKKMEKLAQDTLDALLEPVPRNVVRLALARFMIEVARKEKAAIGLLRDALSEDPDNSEIAGTLTGLLERSGDSSELVDLLARQLDGAKDRQDVEQVVQISLKMGGLLEKDRREEAMDVYRAALDWVPQNRPLLEALLRNIDPDNEARDRAEVLERLLALESPDAAAGKTRELVELWRALEDDDGVQRTLDAGWRVSGDAALRAELEAHYREREDWARLADMLAFDATRQSSEAKAIALVREAAQIRRERLNDPKGAAEALRAARGVAPNDMGLLNELVSALTAAGEYGPAIAEVGSALEGASGKKTRIALLKLRAELSRTVGDDAAAIADLETAYELGGAAQAGDLVAGLEHRRARAAEARDLESERTATMRLVEVLRETNAHERVRDLLAEWVQRDPNDVGALRTLYDLDARAQRWDDAAAAAARLVSLEEGEAQVAAALRLADACDRAGRSEDARGGLEQAWRASPASAELRDRLRALYEAVGDLPYLARVLLADAEAAPDADAQFEALRRAGDVLLRAGDTTAALPPLATAADLRPQDHDTLVLYVDALIGTGRLPDAAQKLEQVIAAHGRRRSPELAQLQHRMSRLAGAADDQTTQLEWLNAALDTDKNNGDVASELAILAMQMGQDEVALKALRAVTLLKNPGPMSRAVAFLRQAQIVYNKGDQQRAVLWARKARVEDPELREADDFLRQIGEA